MHHQARGLVDDDHGAVLVDDVEIDAVLRRLRELFVEMRLFEQLDLVALGHLGAGFCNSLPVHLDAALFNELLKPAAGDVRHQRGQHFVEPLAPDAFNRETW
jgi:hypothetical protein